MISKFRLSDHRLEIESGRYHRPRKKLEDRKCQTCDVLEDEKHCLLSCRINEKAKVTAFNTTTGLMVSNTNGSALISIIAGSAAKSTVSHPI